MIKALSFIFLMMSSVAFAADLLPTVDALLCGEYKPTRVQLAVAWHGESILQASAPQQYKIIDIVQSRALYVSLPKAEESVICLSEQQDAIEWSEDIPWETLRTAYMQFRIRESIPTIKVKSRDTLDERYNFAEGISASIEMGIQVEFSLHMKLSEFTEGWCDYLEKNYRVIFCLKRT